LSTTVHVTLTGSDFTAEGFASIIDYLYTGEIVDVTCGILDSDKLQATLQAAQYFNLPTLDTAARSWAQTSGVTVEACCELYSWWSCRSNASE
jgi:D-alanine-D-alanine ligase-like ATP-grasp enzyme